jgi:hypothetical protein
MATPFSVLVLRNCSIAKKDLASTNQNPRIEWRHEAPPLDSWVLCPKQDLLCYMIATITVASMKY